MSKKFEESETKKCLEKALQGEALAHLKYQFYRSKLAEYNKGYEKILDEIIHNEKEHGKIWFKQLHDGEIKDNISNLLDAMQGETFEHLEMYPKFSEIAKEEGYEEISELFEKVSIIEGNHSKQFKAILEEIKEDYYKEETCWKCLNCGHIVESVNGEAPSECPVCKHPMKYFVKL